MRKAGILLSVCLLAAILGSCSRDLKLPDIKNGEKIVLLGELVAGDSIQIRAGRSVPVSSSSSLTFQPLEGLAMELTEETGGSFPLEFRSDFLADMLHTVAFVSPHVVGAGMSYTLKGIHPTLSAVTAKIEVPSPFSAAMTDTAMIVYGGDTAMRFSLRIQDQPGKQFYAIEAVKQRMVVYGYFMFEGQWQDIPSFRPLYDSLVAAGVNVATRFDTTYQEGLVREELFTDDANTENLQNGGQYTACRRVLLRDGSFDGQAYNIRVYVKKPSLLAAEELDKGKIYIRVRSVSEEYFKYLADYEKYEPVTGLGVNSLPVQIKGNVMNGLGIVGGVYQVQFPYVFDKWEF